MGKSPILSRHDLLSLLGLKSIGGLFVGESQRMARNRGLLFFKVRDHRSLTG